jgi:hypothetical protein
MAVNLVGMMVDWMVAVRVLMMAGMTGLMMVA